MKRNPEDEGHPASGAYVYLQVKLYLKPGQTEESVHNIVQEVEYSFEHEQVVSTEITSIHDMQVYQEE